MAFPTVSTSDTTTGTEASDTTSWTLTWPTNIAAGDLILACLASDGSANATFPAGWVKGEGSPGAVKINVAKFKAAGTETGTFSVTLGSAESGAWCVMRIPVAGIWSFIGLSTSGGNPNLNFVSTGTSTTPDPPNNSLNSAEDVLWITVIAADASTDITAFPTDYSLYQQEVSSGGAGGATLGIAARELNASSENPGTYTLASSVAWAAFTLAIRPATSIPQYIQATVTGATMTGTTAAVTAGGAVANGNLILVQVMQDGTGTTATLSSISASISDIAGTASAMTTLTGSPFNVGNPAAGKQNLFVGRLTADISSGGALFTLNSSGGDDCYYLVHEIWGVNTGANLSDILENSTAGTINSDAQTSATINDVGVTSTAANRLAINLVGVNDDNLLDAFTGASGGTWREVSEWVDATGTDGAVGAQVAELASAGTINGGSDTMAASDGFSVVGFAFIPVAAAPPAALVLQQGYVNFNDPGVL